MGGLIGIEEFRSRNDRAQRLAKAGLTCGNSAGDPDGRHLGNELKRSRSGCVSRKIPNSRHAAKRGGS